MTHYPKPVLLPRYHFHHLTLAFYDKKDLKDRPAREIAIILFGVADILTALVINESPMIAGSIPLDVRQKFHSAFDLKFVAGAVTDPLSYLLRKPFMSKEAILNRKLRQEKVMDEFHHLTRRIPDTQSMNRFLTNSLGEHRIPLYIMTLAEDVYASKREDCNLHLSTLLGKWLNDPSDINRASYDSQLLVNEHVRKSSRRVLSVGIPPIFSALIREAGGKLDILKRAEEHRKKAKAFRECVESLKRFSPEKHDKEFKKLNDKLRLILDKSGFSEQLLDLLKFPPSITANELKHACTIIRNTARRVASYLVDISYYSRSINLVSEDLQRLFKFSDSQLDEIIKLSTEVYGSYGL